MHCTLDLLESSEDSDKKTCASLPHLRYLQPVEVVQPTDKITDTCYTVSDFNKTINAHDIYTLHVHAILSTIPNVHTGRIHMYNVYMYIIIHIYMYINAYLYSSLVISSSGVMNV